MFLYISLSILISCSHSAPVLNNTSSLPLLLLISFDGFRWDYPDIYKLPHFNSILNRGVRVKHIDNVFATVTFPSHFTMVTGLYEETHGIVANKMYDPLLKLVGTKGALTDTKWWSQNPYTEPIWISNQLANDSIQRRSGVIDWPSTGTPVNGKLPVKYLEFNHDRTFDSALKQIFDWFHEPIETRINFGAIYQSEPDETGHRFGPISSEMNKTLIQCDNYVGQLLQIIDSDEYLKTNLNVIITSDHGMHSVDKTHRIILEKYIDKSLYSAYGSRSFANIFVNKNSDIDHLYVNLSVIPNYDVYKKSQIPDVYHYKSNVRIGDILIIGKAGYGVIITNDELQNEEVGNHGYDNREESMHPILYGFGPMFRQNLLAEPFRSVDLYPLMSHILRLNQRSTNGSLNNVKHILVDFSENNFATISILICILLVIVVGIIFIIYACCYSQQSINEQRNNMFTEYQLLSNNEEIANNSVTSPSEDEEERL